MTTIRVLSATTLGSAVVLALTACSFSIGAPATIPAGDVAALAEGTIRDEVGAEIELDCGTEEVAFEVGTVLNCTGTEVGLDQQIPVRVEIVLIDGDYYEIDITSEGAPEPQTESGFVSSADFQEVVASALEQVVGERGVVNCGPDDVEIFVGAELICSVVLSDGFAETLVRVTAFDGSTYEIEAELLE
ncbi:hypothetical protein [Microcella sp.]|uniref:hypothetical protein n=1 Tax=Microcella sp. TaxID=1913979 RepID=UPI00256E4E24|nr:hypothetical protein [Microcella sp.]MBX9470688.1 hypothetical protein [Microcella sp.]